MKRRRYHRNRSEKKKRSKNDDLISEELVNDLFQQFHSEIHPRIDALTGRNIRKKPRNSHHLPPMAPINYMGEEDLENLSTLCPDLEDDDENNSPPNSEAETHLDKTRDR